MRKTKPQMYADERRLDAWDYIAVIRFFLSRRRPGNAGAQSPLRSAALCALCVLGVDYARIGGAGAGKGGEDMHDMDSPQSSQRTQDFSQWRSFGIFSDDYINQK